MYDNFAELYAIIKATENLEKAYVRDIIPSTNYEIECQKLIAHFKTLSSTLKDTIPSIERFHDTYKMDCPAAMNRLIISGVPATVEHRAAAATSWVTSAAVVAACVQNFITTMDSLKLNMTRVDQLFGMEKGIFWPFFIALPRESSRSPLASKRDDGINGGSSHAAKTQRRQCEAVRRPSSETYDGGTTYSNVQRVCSCGPSQHHQRQGHASFSRLNPLFRFTLMFLPAGSHCVVALLYVRPGRKQTRPWMRFIITEPCLGHLIASEVC
ncbi:hypothetical protein L1987_76450 [Smallanthus sonchifolius]|uniref:Uncharacterized protein n=1 Tax=Smallanthus sonchifolius TaxID=185202 RepID=A0ACB8Z7H6_9ASTR|nr:hypothetical protein L1987_76450 [Smallanthus sonchifolius]